MAAVRKHDVRSWYQSFLAQLERVRSADDPSRWRSPEPIRAALEKLEGATGPRPPSTATRARSTIVNGWGPSKRVRCTGT